MKRNKRNWILAGWMVIFGSVSFFQTACAAEEKTEESRPNFLIIVADDLCWRDLGFEGNQDVKTPNLDKLRTESMLLEGMFDPASTCSPTRHALYTGLYPIRSGAYPNHTRLYDGTRSLFSELKDAGYRVALQNKEHVGPVASFPYQHIEGADDLSVTRSFLSRDAKQPWFLVYASNDPHSPWTRGTPADPDKIKIPPYLHDNPVTRKLLAKYYGEVGKFDSQVGNLLKLLEETQQAENTLVLFVSEQGSSFPYGGKWSLYDNGIHASALARWPGKIKPGSNSKALMQYVDVAPTFLEAAGIDPTKVDVKCPDAKGNTGFDGRSFLSILEGGDDQLRDYIFSQHTTIRMFGAIGPYPMRAVRDQRYKLIRNLAPELTFSIGGLHKSQPLISWKKNAEKQHDDALAARVDWLFHRPGAELYDLQEDPYETKNLAEQPEMAEIKERLQKELDQWMDQQGDKGMETEKEAKNRGPAGD
ncbi:sulfatase [Luteolibacter pohnpeiensis]|uniref:Sulfatase n=1 Tax=Luteolibacter pohnpeiensis TaxID=454153 RepID=A0A934S8F3_9BACT|nr:sulfatase [Luteolibacter pohnpeiensis]MBK1881274.1 sulfatase [Luteolibacter pohnpeiensis]